MGTSTSYPREIGIPRAPPLRGAVEVHRAGMTQLNWTAQLDIGQLSTLKQEATIEFLQP